MNYTQSLLKILQDYISGNMRHFARLKSLPPPVNFRGKDGSPDYLTNRYTDIFSALNELTIHVRLNEALHDTG